MHQTTFDYIRMNYDNTKSHVPITFSDNLSLLGYNIVINNNLKPTYTETKWVFPKERFVTYEESDEEWCRYFGIGHQQTKQAGEIIGMDIDLNINNKPKNRTYVWNPNKRIK